MNFRTKIEEWERDLNAKLTFLIQFRTSAAKDTAGTSAMLPDKGRFTRAKKLLHSCTHVNIKGGSIKEHEGEKLILFTGIWTTEELIQHKLTKLKAIFRRSTFQKHFS